MAHLIARKKPIEGINRDIATKYLKDTQARYMQNFERGINTGGSNEGVMTPVPASRLLPVVGIGGNGYTVLKGYESKLTKEIYCWAYADGNFGNGSLHTLYRINQDLSTQVVYQGIDLALSADPVHTIRGAHLFFLNGKKYLCWLDGLNWQGFLDVETSIATNSFKVPYFQLGEFDQEQYWQLVTRPPMHAITGVWQIIDPNDLAELAQPNHMADKTWQFRAKYIYTDGRESEWGPISTSYFVERTYSQKDAVGLPRCIALTFSAGHPQVEKIVLAFRNCNGNAFAETLPFDWEQFLILNKYENCDPATNFWERSIIDDSEDGVISYDPTLNDFTIRFCGEGECLQLPVSETNRTSNGCPITSYALGAVENRLALINNIIDYDQIDCVTTDKFAVSTQIPTAQVCKVETANVYFKVIIHNMIRQVNQPIHIQGANPETEQKLFGGLMYRNWASPYDPPAPYLQNFPGFQEGFIGYVEGTQNFAITRQFKDDQDYGAETNFSSKSKRIEVSRFLKDNKHYEQRGVIKVIKGTKGFIRLAGHRSAPGDDYTNTSTTLLGIHRNAAGYWARQLLGQGDVDVFSREVYFDTCNGDVDVSNSAFIVADLTAPYSDLTRPYAATAVCGYLRDKNLVGVSRAQIEHGGHAPGGSFDSWITDHNGFYFASWAMRDISIGAANLSIKAYVEGQACKKVIGHSGTVFQGGGAMPNETVERDLRVDAFPDYEKYYYASVRLRVQDCRGVAVPGIPFVIKGSKAETTDQTGMASVIVRNRAYAYGNAYTEQAVLMQSETGFTLCNTSCDSCMPDYQVPLPACFSDGAGNAVVVDVQSAGVNTVVQINGFINVGQGLKTGGRYGFSLIFHDASGRHTYVPDAPKYIDMPTIQQMQAFTFATVHWTIQGPLGLPAWVDYMSIVRTANTAFDFAIQWAVNKVTFVDNSGNITSSGAASRIRLAIQSLVENNLNNTTANTLYQFVKGDRLTLLSDDTGQIFPAAAGLFDTLILGDVTVKTLATQNVPSVESYELVIPFDSRLKNLKEGCLIEIKRPYDCVTEQPFFEVADVIDVVGGEPVQLSGVLPSFDTYQIRRTITWENKAHIFPFSFEHHSPSDFWGTRCDDRGRVFFRNRYAKQTHSGRSCFFSDAILENGNRNGLSIFRPDSQVKLFKSEKRGDITACFILDRSLKMLCEHGNFMAMVNDSLVHTGADGIARAAVGDQILIEVTNDSSKFGLAYEDPIGAYYTDGWGLFVDTLNKAIVFDDLKEQTDVTAGRMQNHFSSKLQFREVYNSTRTGLAKIRLAVGFDSIGLNAYVTFQGLGFGDGFIADRPDLDVTLNETFGVSIMDQNVFPFSFTPESYGHLLSSFQGDVFIAFRSGQPWVHKEKNQTQFNNFFGTPVDQRVVLVINNDPDKIKLFIAMQQQTLMKYFCDKVTCVGTDSRTGQIFTMESEIPPAWPKLRENKFFASFLFNKLTPGKNDPLWHGEALRGEYAIVSLVRDNSLNDSCLVQDPSKKTLYNELDNIFFTYAHSEDSAFNS